MDMVYFGLELLLLWLLIWGTINILVNKFSVFIDHQGIKDRLTQELPLWLFKPIYQHKIIKYAWKPLLAFLALHFLTPAVNFTNGVCLPESPAFLSLPESGQDWLDFRSRKLSFVGRSKELEELDKFLNAEPNFSWWWLNGAAGTGKSRLALEWSASHSSRYIPCLSRGYDTGLFRDVGGEDFWRFWQPRRPTVIVIDDAAEHTNRILVLLRDLGQRSKELKYPVRVLLVERAIPEHLKQLDEKVLYSENRYRQDSLRISPLGADDLERLATEIASLRGRALNWTDDQKKHILKISQGRPLFMILAADNLIENNGNISWKESEDILKDQTARTRAKLLQAGLTEACVPLVAMATLTRRLSWETAKLLTTDPECENKGLFDRLYGRDTTQYIPALEPDLLGEYFILQEFANLTESRQNLFLKIAWDASPKEVAETLYKIGGDFREQFLTGGIDRMPTKADQLAWWAQIRVWLLSKENLTEADIRRYWVQLRQLAQIHNADIPVNSAVVYGGAWAIRNFGNLQMLDDMHDVQEQLEAIGMKFDNEPKVLCGVSMGLAHAAGHYGKANRYTEMKRTIEQLESIGRSSSSEIEIQTMLAMGLTNVIDDYDRSPYSEEVPRLFELVKGLEDQFSGNTTIQYMTLYSITSAINTFSRRQSWSNVESSLTLARTIAGRFKDHPGFQLGLAIVAENALNNYGKSKILEKTVAPLEILKEVGARYPYNQAIQEVVSKGIHNSMAAYQGTTYADRLLPLFAHLREISDRFQNNPEIQFYMSRSALTAMHVHIERHEGEKVEELHRFVIARGDIFGEHIGIQLSLSTLTMNKLNYYADRKELEKLEQHLEIIRIKTKTFASYPKFKEILASAVVIALQAYGNNHQVEPMGRNLDSLREIAESLPNEIRVQQFLAIGLSKAAWYYRERGDSDGINRVRKEFQSKVNLFPYDNEIANWWALVLTQSIQGADRNAEESYSKLKLLSSRFSREWVVQMAYIGGMANRMKAQYFAKDKRLSQEFESNLSSAIAVGARFPEKREVQGPLAKVASIAAGIYSARRAADKMQNAIRMVYEIATRFPDSLEIQSDFAIASLNAIKALLSLGQRTEAEEHLRVVQLIAKRFPKDKEIQNCLYDANALFLKRL